MKLEITDFWTASALGTGNDETLDNLLAGRAPGMREIAGDIPGRSIWFGSVAAELPRIDNPHWNMRTNALLALAADAMRGTFAALADRYGRDRIGIVLGSSNTGIDEAEGYVDRWLDAGGADGSAPPPGGFDFSMVELGTPSLFLRERLGFTGPAYTVSTACSSSANAFASAMRLVESGVCDAVVSGGVDGRCRFAMNGFSALGALSDGRCRPFAPDRDGINLGEGVALFVLERLRKGCSSQAAHSLPRRLFLESVGESSDAYHATAPDPSGAGALAAMAAAAEGAGLSRDAFDYVNFHGTGTVANDAMETKALEAFAGLCGGRSPRLKAESTKSLTGHCLGAAGAVEAAICALLVGSGRSEAALSNSFAFGGSNATVAMSCREPEGGEGAGDGH